MAIQDSLFTLLSSGPSANIQNNLSDQDFFLILQTPPEGFIHRKEKFWTCAHHSLKAVIEGKTWKQKPIISYSCDRRSRLTYLMTPWGIMKVLRKNGIKYQSIKAKRMSDEERLVFLKQHLRTWPLILLIGNGMTKKGGFSWRKSLHYWHYITLWGFNDKEQVFYVYDSNTKRETEQYLMKGTIKIPYPYILKSRSIGATKLLYNYAIAVEY